MQIPDRYEETAPGVWEQKEFVDPCSDDRGGDYEERAVRILDVDKGHYERHRDTIRAFCQGMKLDQISAWGGGHPKLETQVFSGIPVYVYDGAAEMYRNLSSEFHSRYGGAGQCWWTDCFVDAEEIAAVQHFTGLNTFCHVLEHQSWESVCRWLRACTSPVLIYGPNVERAKDGWFHFRPPDHNTFATAAAMKSILAERFDVVDSMAIDEDYLVIAF